MFSNASWSIEKKLFHFLFTFYFTCFIINANLGGGGWWGGGGGGGGGVILPSPLPAVGFLLITQKR